MLASTPKSVPLPVIRELWSTDKVSVVFPPRLPGHDASWASLFFENIGDCRGG